MPVTVIPTDRWLGPTVHIPRLGTLKRDGRKPLTVSDEEAKWLLNRFLVKMVEEPAENSSDSSPTPGSDQIQNITFLTLLAEVSLITDSSQ